MKKILNKMLYPPIWLMTLLTVASAVVLPLVFIKGWKESPIAYAVYVLAFYTVSVLCLFFGKVLPKQYKEIKQKIYANPFGNKYMTVIRFILLHHIERKKDAGLIEEYRSYRISAVLMMFINLTLSGIVLNMIVKNEAAAYSDIYVITSAAYTFYILTVSIIDLVKYRKYKSPVMSSAKAIRFAQALVSLLSLEASMLVQFGDDESYRRLMLALTGAGVCIIVLAMSVYMIIRSVKEIKRLSTSSQ